MARRGGGHPAGADRGGQVYYLHNRVENIESTAGRLRQWLGEDVRHRP